MEARRGLKGRLRRRRSKEKHREYTQRGGVREENEGEDRKVALTFGLAVAGRYLENSPDVGRPGRFGNTAAQPV